MSAGTDEAATWADLQPIMQFSMSYAPSRCLTAATQLDVFSRMAEGHATAEAIARAAGVSPRGGRMLLDALAAFGVIRKADGRYRLTPAAERFLVRGRPDYVGSMWEADGLWEAWGHLAEAVRTGRPRVAVEQKDKAEQFFPALVRSLHVMNRPIAERAAEVLLPGSAGRGSRIIDVACGSGVWGIALAEADPQAKVTFQDFPGILAITREYAARHGVTNRSEFAAGDLRAFDFGEGRFDLAILGNIVHSEGERSSRELLGRLRRGLRSGGRVAIIDMVPDEARTGPPFALVFAVNMLVHTTEGDTFTLGEYTAWLKAAGFATVETADIGSHSPMIIGRVDR